MARRLPAVPGAERIEFRQPLRGCLEPVAVVRVSMSPSEIVLAVVPDFPNSRAATSSAR